MEYSIQALSRLSGVTTRTLRWYDTIGLLKPSRIGENGYRYYSGREVDRLQHILYYRALGVPLAQIRQYLDDSTFDRLDALRSHLSDLRDQRSHLEGLIRSVEVCIQAEERKETMRDEKKFEAFKRRAVQANEEAYGAEIRARYGNDEADAAHAAILNLTIQQYEDWTALDQELQQRLESAVEQTLSPDSPEGQAIFRLHKRWLTLTGNAYDAARHRGIAALYVLDERFTAYYDKNRPGCAQFLRDAVHYWA